MNRLSPTSDHRTASWWSRRWLWLAVALALVQAGVFYVLSPKAPGKLGTRLESPQSPSPGGFTVRAATGASPWHWLLTPGVFLLPSAYGFSGAAWLRPDPLELPVGQVTVAPQPLPYKVASQLDPSPALLPRAEAGPALRWGVPEGDARLPEVGLVPLPASGRIRLLAGPIGWKPVLTGDFPSAPPTAGPLLPVIVRVLVGADGEIQGPPVVWRGSGDAEADAKALSAASRLSPVPSLGSGEEDDKAGDPTRFVGIAFLAVEWGSQAASVPGTSAPEG